MENNFAGQGARSVDLQMQSSRADVTSQEMTVVPVLVVRSAFIPSGRSEFHTETIFGAFRFDFASGSSRRDYPRDSLQIGRDLNIDPAAKKFFHFLFR
jgi:hypothetical protein